MITALQTGPFNVNSFVVTLSQNKVFIVDPAACAITGDESKITSYLAKNNLSPVCIILTHGHFDHIPGITTIKSHYPECQIAIHKNDAMALGSTSSEYQRNVLEMMNLEQLAPAYTNLPAPTKTVCGNETLDNVFSSEQVQENLKEWKIIHTPGHTSGSICIYNKNEGVLISGDTLFYQSYGRTDLGGSEIQMMQSLNLLHQIIPQTTLIYPGHDYYAFTAAEGMVI